MMLRLEPESQTLCQLTNPSPTGPRIPAFFVQNCFRLVNLCTPLRKLVSACRFHMREFPRAAHMPEESQKVLDFEVERDGDTAVVKCHGRLVAGTTEEFYQKVKDLLPQTKVVVVDLAELAYVDSTGLGTLVRLHASARKQSCEFKLLHLGKH